MPTVQLQPASKTKRLRLSVIDLHDQPMHGVNVQVLLDGKIVCDARDTRGVITIEGEFKRKPLIAHLTHPAAPQETVVFDTNKEELQVQMNGVAQARTSSPTVHCADGTVGSPCANCSVGTIVVRICG